MSIQSKRTTKRTTKGTKKRTKNNNKKTRRMRGGKKSANLVSIPNNEKSHIVSIFLEMLNMVKLYHWKTRSFSQHRATDELYSELNEKIDTFVEILLGKDESRIQMIEKRIDLIDSTNVNDFKSCIYKYRTFLIDFGTVFNAKRDSDLLNVRDEILGKINQFLYLLTFDK